MLWLFHRDGNRVELLLAILIHYIDSMVLLMILLVILKKREWTMIGKQFLLQSLPSEILLSNDEVLSEQEQ